MMNRVLRVVASAAPGATREQTRDARARAWAYAFECFYRRADNENTPDDHKQFVNKERRTA
jgi:hypothetical protein